MLVDDDRVYPRDALDTYLGLQRAIAWGELCYRGAAML